MRCVFALTGILFIGSVVVAQAPHPWAQWNEGSWIKLAISDGASTTVETNTLTRVGPSTYTLKQQSRQGERMVANEAVFRSAEGGAGYTTKEAQKVGQQNIDVGGRSYPCIIWKTSIETDNGPLEESAWINDAHPLPLKLVTRQGKNWETLNATNLVAKVNIGERELNCVEYRGQRSMSGVRTKVSSWRSNLIPGGFVKETSSWERNGVEIRISREATEFAGKRR
jgi:hypothetical protein